MYLLSYVFLHIDISVFWYMNVLFHVQSGFIRNY